MAIELQLLFFSDASFAECIYDPSMLSSIWILESMKKPHAYK